MKIKQLTKVYIVDGIDILEIPITKIEVFGEEYRYVNDDKSICYNWFKPEQVDTDCFEENTERDGSSVFMVFSSFEKAKNSKESVRQAKAYWTRQKEMAENELAKLLTPPK